MDKYKWLIEILFGGLGTAVIGYIFFKKITNKTLSQKQRSGKNSINLMFFYFTVMLKQLIKL